MKSSGNGVGNRDMEQIDMFEKGENMANNKQPTYTENEKTEIVNKFIELQKEMNNIRAAKQAGASRDSIFSWARKRGINLNQRGPQKEPHHVVVRKKLPSNLFTGPTDDAPSPTPGKTPGNVLVIMGDPESVKAALQTAFNVVTSKQ